MANAKQNECAVMVIDDDPEPSISHSTSQSTLHFTSHLRPTSEAAPVIASFNMASSEACSSSPSHVPPTPRHSFLDVFNNSPVATDEEEFVLPSAGGSTRSDFILSDENPVKHEANPPLHSEPLSSPDHPMTSVELETEEQPISISDSVDVIRAMKEAVVVSSSDDDYFLNDENSDTESLRCEHLTGYVHMEHESEDVTQDRSTSKDKDKSSGAKGRRKLSIMALRNPDVEPAVLKLDSHDHLGIILREKATVELKDEDFLKIMVILQDVETGAVSLRGHRFRRTRFMNGMFDMKRNEVCWIQEVDEDDTRLSEVQSMETVSVTEVVKRRRLRLTNQAYPALSFRTDDSVRVPDENDPSRGPMLGTIHSSAVLVCRMKFVRFFTDAEARRRNIASEKVVFNIRQDECDPGNDNKVTDLQLRAKWRGNTEKGGAQAGWEPGEKEFLRQEALSHAGKPCTNSLLIAGRKYEAGDVMTRGAVGDMLVRDSDSDSETIYQKLSGVNEPCFARSSFNIVTEKEIIDTPVSRAQLSMKMEEALHGVQREGGAFYMNEDRRPEIRATIPRDSPEVFEIDAHLKKTHGDIVYQQRIEGRITSTISPRLGDNQRKRAAAEAFPLPAMTIPSSLRETPKEQCSIDLTGLVPRGFPTQLPSDNASGVKRESTADRKVYKVQHTPGFQLGAKITDASFVKRPAEQLKAPAWSQHSGTRAGSLSRIGPVLDASAKQSHPKSMQRRYTFGDCFCGAGGMSRGAVMAGLRVKWGFDFNDIACYSYALNFLGARVYHEQAHVFATSKADQKIDVCHMSPPCQFFSPAHTVAGQDDEMNIASFLAVGELLNKTRPRVVVLEQTAGLVNRHEMYFHTCVREFTERGFNVRWKIISCSDFGLPQRRPRLFMIASCPGEPLPPFATPTHEEKPLPGSSLKPWVTINSALAKIPEDWANHDVNDCRPLNDLPDTGDKIASCITTNGGENRHPSGTRSYTHREFACLQGFPLGHKFGTMEIRKQIGNAVAPIVGKAILEEVIRTLKKTDGVEG